MSDHAPILKIERAALMQALNAAIGAVSSKSTIPVLTHFLLDAEGDSLVVTGTNLDTQTTVVAPAQVTTPGRITVPAKALHEIVRRTREGAEISIEVDPIKLRTVVAAGRSRFTLPSYAAEDFPKFTDNGSTDIGEFSQSFEIAGSILSNMIGKCWFAISTEETRYYLNGIYCHALEVDGVPTLRFVATDGKKLARIDTARASGLTLNDPGVIFPRKTVELIKKAADEAGEAMVTIEHSQRVMRATVGSVAIISKLIEGTFPDYVRVIPTSFAREAVAPTVGLIESVLRVSPLAAEDNARNRGVKLEFEEGQLKISAHDVDGSDARDELDIDLEGEPLTIGFAARFLSDTLAQVGSDTVRIKLGTDATQPAVIGDKLAEALFVLMPYRVT